MKLIRSKLSLSLSLLLPFAAIAGEPIPKQLAGPPSEFAAMQAPDPAAAAIHSKSALLPIRFAPTKSGAAELNLDLPVENGRLRFMLFSGAQAGQWQVGLRDPAGRTQPSVAAKHSRRAEFGIEQARFPGEQFTLDGVANGRWKLTLRAAADAPSEGYLLLEGDPTTELASYATHRRHLVGERIGFAALLTHSDVDGKSIALGRDAGEIRDALLQVTAPDGTVATYPMFDDGKHGDGAAGDGVYGGEFVAHGSGQHLAQVRVDGIDVRGQAVVRTAEHVVPVVPASISLRQAKANGRAGEPGRFAIELPVAASRHAGHYRAFAEVWGRDIDGNAIPVAWIGGMATPQRGRLKLGLDQRWITLAGARAPFELRNVRIEDPDHFVAIAEAARMPLRLPAVSSKALPSRIVVDDLMTMGPKPERVVAKGVGSRLLLVHGYCSGGVWPASQFSNASTFLDANANRTHDQFARMIASFGSTWNSFGTVAHSQGGAASLHLYTYYWSGLDYATGNRLMQSVGTPYQGTNLAGILAALGSWFGVGCGTNDNLSYSGASTWLAGIPSWARSKVHYYTTSFKYTNWWSNDYCNFATDLVLSDPEDGTTEKAYGQLSGAVNQGHTSGQCHTTGMRDPAQYLDANRNSIMNANAAR